ncbi:MAG: Wzz/FepE/Etk N-terminal domain-containing protein [Rhodobacteraceae bacterium]|nr:Wzz/FepE/Etk N-terminal domain-containing protein [Paracoccaceae bacterium]
MKPLGLRFDDGPDPFGQPPGAAPAGGTVALGEVLAAARRQRRVILRWVAAFAAAGLVYLVTTPADYTATSTVMLGGKVNRSLDEISTLDTGALTDNAIEDARQVILSERLAREVTRRLALDRNPAFTDPPKSLVGRIAEGAYAAARLPIELVRGLLPGHRPAGGAGPGDGLFDKAARTLQGEVSVARLGKSSAFLISYSSHDPGLTAEVVNTYAEAYVADLLDANLEVTDKATAWLQGRLDELRESSRKAAMEAEAFRAAHGLISSGGALVTEDKVAKLNADLAEATSALATAEAGRKVLDEVIARGADGLLTDGGFAFLAAADARLQSRQRSLSTMIAQLEEERRAHGADSAQVRLREAEVRAEAERVLDQVRGLAQSAEATRAVAAARVEALKASLAEAVSANDEASMAKVQLVALEQRAEALSSLYQMFLKQFEEIDRQKTFPISNVRILSTAETPETKSGPGTLRTLILAMIVGALAGIVHASLREWSDQFLRTGDEVRAETRRRFLGYLPAQGEGARRGPRLPARLAAAFAAVAGRSGDGARPAAGTPPSGAEAAAAGGGMLRRRSRVADGAPARLSTMPAEFTLAQDNPLSPHADAVRAIRFASDIDRTGGQAVVIGITSPGPVPGKTALAANLAASLAASGESTLLADVDLRDPALSRRLGLGPEPGLLSAVAGRTDWSAAVLGIGAHGLQVLGCEAAMGDVLSGSALGLRRLREVIAEARRIYRYVVLDLPPIGDVVEAHPALALADQIVLVARWGRTPRGALAALLRNEPALADRLIGTVIDEVDAKGLGSYLPAGGAAPGIGAVAG